MRSLVYVTFKVFIDHESTVDPCDVADGCLYNIEASIGRGDQGTIVDTEMVETENRGQVDPESNALIKQG